MTPDEMVKTADSYSQEMEDILFRFNGFLSELAAEIRTPPEKRQIKKSQLVDMGFLLRTIQHSAHELRKQAEAHKNACSIILCKKIVEHTLQFPSAPERAEGKLASATPNIKPQPRIPKVDTPEWQTLCDYFDIPKAARELVAFDWKRTGVFLLRAAHEGVNVPREMLQEAGTEYNVTYRKKRNGKLE